MYLVHQQTLSGGMGSAIIRSQVVNEQHGLKFRIKSKIICLQVDHIQQGKVMCEKQFYHKIAGGQQTRVRI